MKVLLLSLCIGMTGKAFAQDYTYQNGKCVNAAGDEGLNPDYIGECGNLPGKNLAGMNLKGISFRGANLEKADMSGGVLTLAQFNGANLKLAKFKDADLRSADLLTANLKGAYFLGTIINDTTKLPFDVEEAKLRGMIYFNLLLESYGGTGLNETIDSPTWEYKFEAGMGEVARLVVEVRAAACASDFDDYSIFLIDPFGNSVRLQTNANGDSELQDRASGVRFGDVDSVPVPDLENFSGNAAEGEWTVRFMDDDSDTCEIENLWVHFDR